MKLGQELELRIPSISSIYDVARLVDDVKDSVGIIADGGIRTPGDVAKAIAVGANCVMLGSLLAGTKETPGKIIRTGMFPDEKLVKQYQGSASLSSKLKRNENGNNIEGNSKLVAYKGKAKRIIDAITDGLKSSMSYVGAKTIEDFQLNAELIKVTNAGMIEARPHLLDQ